MDDLISRQAAIDAFERFIHELGIEDEPYNYGEIALSIQNVPPVTPQPKTGYWIFVDKAHKHAHCSECDYGDVDLMDGRPHNYCPNCGAKMVKPQERSDKE